MPAEYPQLSGLATKDLVETIGNGSFKASYINWSRTMELLRKHAPGWMPEMLFSHEGTPLHRAPVGGFLLMRLRHVDGTVTPEVPQAVMDHRNSSIPWDKITSRDISDTERRGSCLVVAKQFGLAHELWAKMPLESGYQVADEETIAKARTEAKASKKTSTETVETEQEVPAKSDKEKFVDFAKEKGLCAEAIQSLVDKIESESNGNFAGGIRTLEKKDKAFVEGLNAKFLADQY